MQCAYLCSPDLIKSQDRVMMSFFYGSKHIDRLVPKVEPMPRRALMESKQAEWAMQSHQARPVELSMYQTTNQLAFQGKA